MPVTHWVCPDDKPTAGEIHTPEFCITECPHKCISPFLIAALTTSNRRNHHKGKYISATSLFGCVRSGKLERTVDYAEYLKNSLYGYRGTVMHQVVEDASEIELIGLDENGEKVTLSQLGYLTEWRMLLGFCLEHGGFSFNPEGVDIDDEDTYPACPFDDHHIVGVEGSRCEIFLLGGTLDGLEPHWDTFDETTGVLEGTLWDMKTMAEFALKLFILGKEEKYNDKNKYHPNIKDSYIVQANVYKYLAERSDPPEVLKEKGVRQIKLKVGNIQGFGMNHFPRSGAQYEYKKHWKHEPKLWDIPSITFWPDDEIEEYIKKHGEPILRALILDEIRGPICEPADNKAGLHSWLCVYCAFHGSTFCPAPDVEWQALQDGKTEDEAFDLAYEAWEHEQ